MNGGNDTGCLEVLLYREDWPIVPFGIVIERMPGLMATVQVARQLVPLG